MHLTARREPTFLDGAHPDSGKPVPHGAHHAGTQASGFTRFISTVQIVGSLLAVPVGLASAYSIYRANFSVETTCQSLRGNIIGMLDKNVDVATRRMLVRRDIEAFERDCGAVDPDAHAAFKLLLAGGAKAAAASTTASIVVPKSRPAAPATEAAHKSDARPVAVTKAPAVAVEPDTSQQDASLSDARWLAAVRQALVTHGPERAEIIEQAKAATVKPLRADTRTEAPVASRAPASPPSVLQSSWAGQPPAPALPRPVDAAPAPQVQPASIDPVNADHPVPPAPIPTLAATGFVTPVNAEPRASSRGSWLAQIPFVGRMIEPRGN